MTRRAPLHGPQLEMDRDTHDARLRQLESEADRVAVALRDTRAWVRGEVTGAVAHADAVGEALEAVAADARAARAEALARVSTAQLEESVARMRAAVEHVAARVSDGERVWEARERELHVVAAQSASDAAEAQAARLRAAQADALFALRAQVDSHAQWIAAATREVRALPCGLPASVPPSPRCPRPESGRRR